MHKRTLTAALLLIGSLLGSSCRQPTRIPTVQLIAGRTMGTTYSIKLVPSAGMPALTKISAELEQELERVNQQMSTYLPDSELSQFNRLQATDWFDVSPETAQVAELAVQIYRRSDGAFDCTVGPLVNLWGFGPDGRPSQIPGQDQIDEILTWIGSDKLQVRLLPPAIRKQHPKIQIDLSAIAKGHAVDRLAAILDRLGIDAYFVEIGGEVRTRGVRIDGQPWQTGIERPDEASRSVQQVIGLSNQALATSGDYRNYYELEGRRFSHTIDPKNGWPVQDPIASASVVADNCALADAVATSMMSAGFEKGLELAERNGWAVLLMRRSSVAGEDFQTATSTAFRVLFP